MAEILFLSGDCVCIRRPEHDRRPTGIWDSKKSSSQNMHSLL